MYETMVAVMLLRKREGCSRRNTEFSSLRLKRYTAFIAMSQATYGYEGVILLVEG
jgi:hypothetical protein